MIAFRTIYLDHDVKYSSWPTSQKYDALTHWLPKIVKQYFPCRVYIRESATGKVHLRLDFDEDVPIFDTMQIRALLADDVFRLIMDLKRCFTQPEETNRIFDEKWIDGQLRRAGEWKNLPLEL